MADQQRPEPLTSEQIAEWKRLSQAATPGPWRAEYDRDDPVSDHGRRVYEHHNPGSWPYEKAKIDGNIVAWWYVAGPGGYEHDGQPNVEEVYEVDARFIAAAREAVPALCDALDAERARVAELRTALADLWAYTHKVEGQALIDVLVRGWPSPVTDEDREMGKRVEALLKGTGDGE